MRIHNASFKGIHWGAPTSTIASLVASVLLAVGHHLFYRSLDGTPVTDNAFFGFMVSQQQVNIAVGTTFAFLARACMVVCISIAFVQIFWHAIDAGYSSDAPPLERIDAVHSVLDNAFEMLNFKSWTKYPLLMLTAGLAWLVPIASVITPATLSVRPAPVLPIPVSVLRVSNLDFRNLNYLAQMPYTWLPRAENYTGPQPFYFDYQGPSDAVLQMTNAVASIGEIMPIPSPGLNSSWDLEFYGPSVECNDVDAQVRDDFAKRLSRYLSNTKNGGAQQEYGYLAWHPTWDGARLQIPLAANLSGPASLALYSESAVINIGSLVPGASIETLNRSSTSLGLMVMTQSFKPPTSSDSKKDPRLQLRSCQLYNATYRASLDYTSGSQKVNVSLSRDHAQGPIQSLPGVLQKYANAATDTEEFPCAKPGSKGLRCCYNDPALLQTLAYQAVMDAFTGTFQGAIYKGMLKSDGVWIGSATSFYANTSIMQTRLSQADDLGYIRTALRLQSKDADALSFQDAVAEHDSEVLVSANDTRLNLAGTYTVDAAKTGTGSSLADTIEELFTNLTISLMSSAALQPNYTSPTAPSPAYVTFHRYHNSYVYSPQKLWLTYGIALLVTGLALIAGLMAMFLNKASYSMNFSTILRAASGAQLSTAISQSDANGRDPLPKYLAKAQVWLQGPAATVVTTSDMHAPGHALGHATGSGKVPASTVRLLRSDSTTEVVSGLGSQDRERRRQRLGSC